ncbi:MAG: C25 family cysteine peptidase [Kiritimatiellia bacterium]
MWLTVHIRPCALRQFVCTVAAVCAGALPIPAAALAPAPATVRYAADGASVSVRFDFPQIRRDVDGLVEISLTNAFPAEQAGLPVLPEAVVVVELPEGAQVSECLATPAESTLMVLNGRVRHGRVAASYSAEPGEASVPDPDVYALDTPYPEIGHADWSIEHRGARRVVNVRLSPVQYVPALDLLLVNHRMDVTVRWTVAPPASQGAEKTGRLSQAAVRSLAGLALPVTGRVDYIVITSPDLLATPAPYNFQALCAARTRGGLIATTVTTDWIYANYAGVRPDGATDNPTRIRQFIQDAQQNWGTRFVLLGGTAARVPTRLMYGNVQSVKSAPIASDMYYACLDGTFDSNANGVYGEPGDGEGGRDVDLVAEVYVGRFPVNTAAEVVNMVRKTLAYENATSEQLRKISHMGEYLGFGGVSQYATDSMEQLRLGGSYDGYATTGFGSAANAARFDISDRLYDASGYTWNNTEVVRRFQQDYHVFNHLGHGNWGYCFRLNLGNPLDRYAISGLTNSSYFLAYSQACESGRFDDVTDCLAETLVTASNGPAALIMNTRDGWGVGDSTAGPSQYFHRYFWDELLSGRSYLLGEANQKSKEDVRYAVNYYGGAMRWCYYELTLFGDPGLPFGARISSLPPVITFVPLQNQFETQTSYRVACSLGPVGLYDPDSPQLIWRTSLEPGLVHTTRMDQTVGPCYESFLPAVPREVTIYYSIRAASRAGQTDAAPRAGEYSFRVTSVFTLTVAGSPQTGGDVTPPYGLSQIASGNLVCARASLREILSEAQALRCVGWQGSGSVPAAGNSNGVDFVVEQSSTLTWQWTDEYALRQRTSPAGFFETNTWCLVGTTTGTLTAASCMNWHGTNFLFAGWCLDGARVPLTGRATNRVGGIVMNQLHDAEARYLPETQDADLDLVPDWWELYYYGTTEYGAAVDTDGDGAGLYAEYLAQTDPTDPESHPLPPVITVTPLPTVLAVPPPYTVYATIEDTSPLAVAQVVWQINAGVLQTGVLTSVSSGTNLYVGMLGGSAVSGDEVVYSVQAVGLDGLSAHSATYTTRLQYAVIVLGAPVSRAYITVPPGPVGDWLTIFNRGTASLTWQAYAGFGEYADALPSSDWNLNASGIPWTRSTTRSFSAPAALRANIVSSLYPGGYGLHAAMTSPPIQIGTGALLAFSYWINSELDSTRAGFCWDGAMVEISTNGGLTFVQLSGSYTHAISGWYASPWPEGTPCFAGAGDGWHDASFDLSVFAGTTAILRFNYGADDNTDKEGWYVDNIRVAPLAPAEVPGTTLSPAADAVAPEASRRVQVAVDTSRFNRRWTRLPVLIRSNDPLQPVLWYELVFDSWYPYILSMAGTNGVVIGNGSGASLPAGTDFGSMLVGTGARTNTFSISNFCDDALFISSVATSGVGAAAFTIFPPPAVIPARTSVCFSVVFTPQAGPQEAVLTFLHSGTNAPFAMRLAGFGASGGMQFSTHELVFAATYAGSSPAAQTVGLGNLGGTGFTFANRIVYGPGASDWLSTLPTAGTVALGGACVLTNTINVAGLAVGTYVATNSLTAADATNSPQAYVVTLTVAKAHQTMHFANPDGYTVTDRVVLCATASSAQTVSYALVDGPAAISNQNQMSFGCAGRVRVRAEQVGDDNWYAVVVTNTFDVLGVITNVTPSAGTMYGGTQVTLSGLWLGNGTDITQVMLCDVVATVITQDMHQVIVHTGASPMATNADVTVRSAGFGVVTLDNGFTYQPVPPPPVALSAIAITTNRFTARWTVAASATNYLLDVSTNSTFDSHAGAYHDLGFGDVTACLVTGLTDRTTYYYRVRAANSHGSSTNSNMIVAPVGANVPYLLYEQTNGVVSAGATDVMDLTRLFHGTNMSYAVVANSNTGLISTGFAGTNLVLQYAAGATGTARITIRVTDANGFQLENTVVVMVVPVPGVQAGPIVLNRQNGLYEQIVIVSNASPVRASQAVTLTVTNLSAACSLYNATGRDRCGNPEIYWSGSLPALAAMSFTLQYYTATRGVVPSATVLASLSLALPGPEVCGSGYAIRGFCAAVGNAQAFLIEFAAVPGRVYYIQYTDALTNSWRTVCPELVAPVNRMQWLDVGPPGTECAPKLAPVRFYRVIEK